LSIISFALLLPQRSHSSELVGTWDQRFYTTVMPNARPPNTITFDDQGRLLAGGYFEAWGGKPTPHLARWNGHEWEGVGQPLTIHSPLGFSLGLLALATQGEQVVVGGTDLVAAGGRQVRNIALWNGNDWSGLGGGIDGTVHEICWNGDRIYVGGVFRYAGDVQATNVAYWDGNNWHALGGGLDGVPFGIVEALAIHQGDLFAGGDFSHSGSTVTPTVAKWTGTAWTPVGDPVLPPQGAFSLVMTLLSHIDGLYAGGNFALLGGRSLHGIARWDGSAWRNVGGALENSMGSLMVKTMAPSQEGILVGGTFDRAGQAEVSSLALWESEHWNAVHGPRFDWVDAVATKGQKSAILGYSSDIPVGSSTALFRLETNTWHRMGHGFAPEDRVRALATAPDGVVAGGWFRASGHGYYSGLARFDGENWNPVGNGLRTSSSGLEYVTAVGVLGTNVVIGGRFNSAGTVEASNVALWDGTKWSPMGGGLREDVRAMAVSGSRVYSGCESGVVAWDGVRWSSVGLDSPTAIAALVAEGEVLYAGSSRLHWGAPESSVHRWDGSRWDTLARDIPGWIWAMTLAPDGLYVGGSVTNVAGTAVSGLARWHEGTWSTVGMGLTASGGPAEVLGLATDPMGRTYAVGNFNRSGVRTLRNVACFVEGEWRALGSGLRFNREQPVPQTLTWWQNTLYIGGEVVEAGGYESMHFAAWHDPLLPLSVEVMGQPATVPGQESELRIKVSNLADQNLAGTRLILNAPEGAVCLSGSEGAVTVPQWIRWELGELAPGFRTLTAVVRMPDIPGAVIFRDVIAEADEVISIRAPWYTMTVEEPSSSASVALVEPAPRSRWEASIGVPLRAEVDPDTPTTAVEFYAGTNLLDRVITPPFGLTWREPPAGNHLLRAVSYTESGHKTTSLPVPVLVFVKPANDDFINRQPLTGLDLITEADTTGATTETGEPWHGGIFGFHSLWYTWTAPADGRVMLRSIAWEGQARLGVYSGDTLENVTVIPNVPSGSGTDPYSDTALTVLRGTTFQIAIDAFPPGACRLQLTFVPAQGMLQAHVREDGSLALSLLAESGSDYALEVSSDLLNWIALGTHRAIGSWLNLPEILPTADPSRFYRVVRR